MLIAQYFIEFIFYSFLGWVWESIYCTANEKKWADRGFLFGPICPIYGSCVVVTSIVFSLFPALSDPSFPIWGIFIICYIGSAVAEFGTSWVLEKRFHARWWDYSHMPLNIQGRICVPVSIAFGVAGVLIVKYLIPFVTDARALFNPYVTVFFALVLAMIFGADFALTEASLNALLKNVEEMHQEFNARAQDNYEKLASKTEALAQLYSTRLSFNQKRILGNMKKYIPEKKLSLELAESKQKLIEHLKSRL
ncbi:putative ABC transporter permease [Butyrivibrio sp. VCB2006]|uniref:putative ABC transporter permease n=1 Tax=Butyrivibrio sp. VCB2006 TaxID=1280679 RepID=UPI00041C6970|nr:putative ABC transporter permease [Butyrivibrio sp. VCB2006]